MTKTEKNKIIIIVLYFLSFLIFDLVSVGIMFDGNLSKMIGGNYNFFELLASFANAGVYHFIFVSFIAICTKFNKKINIEYKNIIRWFPLCTFIFALPMCIPTAFVVRSFLYIFGLYE